MAFVGWFLLAVVGLVTLLVGFHVVNALATPTIRRTGDTPAPDELDRIIELRAAKLSGTILATVVMTWSIIAMFGIPAVGVAEVVTESAAGKAVSPAGFAVPVTQAVFWVHLLFAGFVIANITYYGGIVAAYRRLAHG